MAVVRTLQPPKRRPPPPSDQYDKNGRFLRSNLVTCPVRVTRNDQRARFALSRPDDLFC